MTRREFAEYVFNQIEANQADGDRCLLAPPISGFEEVILVDLNDGSRFAVKVQGP